MRVQRAPLSLVYSVSLDLFVQSQSRAKLFGDRAPRVLFHLCLSDPRQAVRLTGVTQLPVLMPVDRVTWPVPHRQGMSTFLG